MGKLGWVELNCRSKEGRALEELGELEELGDSPILLLSLDLHYRLDSSSVNRIGFD